MLTNDVPPVGPSRKLSDLFKLCCSTIYTLDTICVPNIMILAHAVLQVFCWQGSIGLQCISRKRELIQPNIYRILSKVNQIIYTLDKICVPNIMVLAQAVLWIFCWHGSIGLQCISRIRAVAEQLSLPELCLANKTKMHLKQNKKELKIANVSGCSIFWPAAPPHGIYLGVSSYEMETDPPMFLYLKDECFLMTDICDIDISLIMKNSKSVTLTSRSVRRCWGGDGIAYTFRPISNIRYSIC